MNSSVELRISVEYFKNNKIKEEKTKKIKREREILLLVQFVFIHRWIIRNVATPKCFLPTGTTHEYSGWNVGERGERRGKEVRWLQPRRRSRPSRIAVTCWTIRPRSPSNRREATVRSRLLHLLPPSNPPRGEEGTRSKRPRSTADTQTLAPQQARTQISKIYAVYTCGYKADPCFHTYTGIGVSARARSVHLSAAGPV